MSQNQFGPNVHIMDHPLVAHKLTIMRDKNTSVKDFRELVSEVGMFITYEAMRDLPLTTKEVETPLCKAMLPTLAGKKIAVVPILRAGLGLVDGVLRMMPSARVGHIGMYRDEETLEPHVYFCKMPKDIAEREVMIVDPMLATGGSADAAITEMEKRGCRRRRRRGYLALPLGELSAELTERVFITCPLRPRCARTPLPKGEARARAISREVRAKPAGAARGRGKPRPYATMKRVTSQK